MRTYKRGDKVFVRGDTLQMVVVNVVNNQVDVTTEQEFDAWGPGTHGPVTLRCVIDLETGELSPTTLNVETKVGPVLQT